MVLRIEPPKLIEAVPLVGSGEVFEPLRDPEYFRQLRIEEFGISVEWPNEADIAPETLYDHVQRAAYEQRRGNGS
jgi:Protein of unknown function (DUF2442)